MLKAWLEEFKANQELKRRIELEKWEQEKRWREEDRAATQKAIAANAVGADEHGAAMKAAAGVSYLTLVCHEDTWTFVATEAFGRWKPCWITSTHDQNDTRGPNTAWVGHRWIVNPNLPEGRITKDKDGSGMQKVVLSGHNLVRILEALREGASTAQSLPHAARCRTLYSKFADFAARVDPNAPAGQTTGVEFRIDDTVDLTDQS
ncbi:hypothetical protein AB0D86_43320 [Streptomyces sp. NPDC048324]|uniref:hypothetical protein n=1 Tax=Streptomyces sp. NPDC048324 TaxID=3157205 RepID=UPI003427AA24